MSKQHPQSGPSLSKPTYKPKSRREQEAEDAEAKLQEVERGEKATGKEAKAKTSLFEQAREWGGRIPFRGGDSEVFWERLHKKQKEKREEIELEKKRQNEEKAKLFAEWQKIK